MLNNKGFLRKTHNCIHLLINTHYCFCQMLFFAETKPPEAAPPKAQRRSWYWRHPITLRSLVVRSTDVGPNCFQQIDIVLIFLFQMLFFAEKTRRRPPRRRPSTWVLSWYWRHPITLRSLVVRSTDVGPQKIKNVHMLLIRLELLGSSGMCLGGLRKSLGTTFVKI